MVDEVTDGTDYDSSDVQQRATSILNGYVPPLSSHVASWEVTKNETGRLEINRKFLKVPLLSDIGTYSRQLQQHLFSKNQVDLSEDPNLSIMADIPAYQKSLDVFRRLKDCPFKLHYYKKAVPLPRDDIEKNHVLTLLSGELSTQLHDSDIGVPQRGVPGEIIVGRKRGGGAKHTTTVEKGSAILVRVDGDDWSADPLTFWHDLAFLYDWKAKPELTPSHRPMPEGMYEFDVDWTYNGQSLTSLV